MISKEKASLQNFLDYAPLAVQQLTKLSFFLKSQGGRNLSIELLPESHAVFIALENKGLSREWYLFFAEDPAIIGARLDGITAEIDTIIKGARRGWMQ